MTLPANDQDAARTLLSRVNQKNITNDERRELIAKALREARAEEREECAKVADAFNTKFVPDFQIKLHIAAAIRARGSV